MPKPLNPPNPSRLHLPDPLLGNPHDQCQVALFDRREFRDPFERTPEMIDRDRILSGNNHAILRLHPRVEA